jgi:hypothetical protein
MGAVRALKRMEALHEPSAEVVDPEGMLPVNQQQQVGMRGPARPLVA